MFYSNVCIIFSFCVRDNLIASSGEDRCVMIWFGTKYESIALPAQSVWSVALLANKDVVTGSRYYTFEVPTYVLLK